MKKLEAFDMKNIPHLLDVVVPLWSPSIWDDDFKRFNVEYIVRNNIWENEYCFQLVDEDTLIAPGTPNFLAAAFFARKTDRCAVEEWFARESNRFPKEYLAASAMSRTYLTMMDERTLSLMNDDDIKLSLFISCQPGSGSLILEQTCDLLRRAGWKNLYLWTDCECNWEWYNQHGYTLVQEDTYEPFSSPDEDYKTYIFKRKL
jgi:hypothetical protein